MSQYLFSVEVYCHELGYSKEIEIVADWTYTPFSRGAREGGLAIEPDEEESFEIDHISLNSTTPDPLELAVLEEFESCADFEALVEAIKTDAINNAEAA